MAWSEERWLDYLMRGSCFGLSPGLWWLLLRKASDLEMEGLYFKALEHLPSSLEGASSSKLTLSKLDVWENRFDKGVRASLIGEITSFSMICSNWSPTSLLKATESNLVSNLVSFWFTVLSGRPSWESLSLDEVFELDTARFVKDRTDLLSTVSSTVSRVPA